MPHPEFDIGSYWGKFVGMRDDKSPNGTPYVALRFKVLSYWHNEQWEDAIPVDTERDVRMFVTEAAEPYTIKALERLGWNGDWDRPEFSGFEAGCTMLECSINKDGYENWNFPAPNRDATPWDKNDRLRFAAKYKQQARRDVAPARTSAPSAPPPGPKAGQRAVKDAVADAVQQPIDTSPPRDEEVPGGVPEGVADVSDDEIPF